MSSTTTTTTTTTISIDSVDLTSLSRGLEFDNLPEHPGIDSNIAHAPVRTPNLTSEEFRTAVANALRYFHPRHHSVLGPEFAEELRVYGHIYMYRFRPTAYEMRAHPISSYPARTRQAASIMLMIQNNLDPRVAQFPHELITYGGNGSVFSNWAQYHLAMFYLSKMSEDQTLAMYSGHPAGLFPSSPQAPRVIVTNGMVIPNHSSKEDYDKMYAMGNSQYGQMTAGSYCYIGPQGIVHGTTLTLLGAARKYLGTSELAGRVFVTAGLGGMSGAQPKAGVITGAICVCAEVSEEALNKRYTQGWVQEKCTDMEELITRIKTARKEAKPVSIGFLGNVVDLWERLAEEPTNLVDLGSDQTSCHNPFNGGYYPTGLSFAESNELMKSDPAAFKIKVQESLRRHIKAINTLVSKGMRFWDYGNSFMLEARRAGADINDPTNPDKFRYPSYVQDIMGDIFSLGFGPFRWVCTSGRPDDLEKSDKLAEKVMASLASTSPIQSKQNYEDNLTWIQQAGDHKLVVGSQARILYSDAVGRTKIAQAFNDAVASGEITAPIVISRDHHDVSGTDSPWRETSNITDGSHFTADMAIQNVIGDSFRGATWVAIHNGGGTGWGEAINGGFGLVLDGTPEARKRATEMLHWDVNNGVNRRAWDRNENALFSIKEAMKLEPKLQVTLPNLTDQALLDSITENSNINKRKASSDNSEASSSKKRKQ